MLILKQCFYPKKVKFYKYNVKLTKSIGILENEECFGTMGTIVWKIVFLLFFFFSLRNFVLKTFLVIIGTVQ